MNDAFAMQEASSGLLSKANHALGLESGVPKNDKAYPVSVWEELVEYIGKSSNCPASAIARAKARYTYYMLYFGTGL